MPISQRALHIQNTLGTRVAAGFLRNQGLPITVALHLLTRKPNH